LFVDHIFKPFPESITTLVPSVEIGLSGQPGHAHWATPLTPNNPMGYIKIIRLRV
jgi:hypothetical protein